LTKPEIFTLEGLYENCVNPANQSSMLVVKRTNKTN